MKNLFIFTYSSFISMFCMAQDRQGDTLVTLGDIVVKGFDARQSRQTVPASVHKLSIADLGRFNNTSLVPAVNTIPGVRMEERSPGSYRLSVRGSLLRSPFGVRNVKVYWDDFFLTDAGGNTYLNLVDINAMGGIEIMKGPAGSIYGAGTGGAVTLFTPDLNQQMDSSMGRRNEFKAQLTAGSYGQFSENFSWKGHSGNTGWQVTQGHYQCEGYRDNSRMRRDFLQANLNTQTGRNNRIDAFLVLADLAYRTPGGLTRVQADTNPRQARPPTAVLPGAEAQQAGVRNRTLLTGLANTYKFNDKLRNTTALTLSFTDFANPFITNYEQRTEQNIGIRSKFVYDGKLKNMPLRWIGGLEWQAGFYEIDSAGNNGGTIDRTNEVTDKVRATQGFLFTQADLWLSSSLVIQLGLSLNDFAYQIERVKGTPSNGKVPVRFDLQLAPRLALLYRVDQGLSLFASLSKGYSPPSLAEVRPSAGGINSDLQAEQGWSVEGGIRATTLRSRLRFDLAVFQFQLQDAIVRRVNQAGAEFFVNAGDTRQRGIEAHVEGYPLINQSGSFIRSLRLWSSYTFSDFKFGDYKVNNNDFSGNELTGVPRQVFLAGADIRFKGNIYWYTTFNYTSRLPLTDANTVYAPDYRLWQSRVGWRHRFGSLDIEIFTGIDNALNENYSLGNDINAFGGRYFNPAPARNYYGGLILKW